MEDATVPATYDTAEALEMLARATQQLLPVHYRRKAVEAADGLLKAILQLNQQTGIEIRARDNQEGVHCISIGTTYDAVLLMRDEDGQISLGRWRPQGWKPVPNLEFNAIASKWEGTKEDTFVVPTPGQPRRRQSAMAAVMEAVVAVLITPKKSYA
jgi:hypothetical protein